MKNRKSLKTLLCASSSLMMAMAAISPVATAVIPVIANETETGEEPSNNTVGSILVKDMPEGTEYNVYQLFTGTFVGEAAARKITNVNFAGNNTKAEMIAAYNAVVESHYTPNAGDTDQMIANKLASLLAELNATQKIGFANEVAKRSQNLTQTGTITTTNSYLSVSSTGYYILVPKDRPSYTSNSVTTDAILMEVTEGVNDVSSKDNKGKPKPEKTVEDPRWESDNFVLDYTIKTNVSSNLRDFSMYTFTIQDTLPNPVKANETEVAPDGSWNVVVTALYDGKEYSFPAGAYTTEIELDGGVVKWNFNDLKTSFKDMTAVAEPQEQTDLLADDVNVSDIKIQIKYSVKLDAAEKNSLFGNYKDNLDPITNTVNVEYPNDPRAGGSGTIVPTPDVPCKVQTYSLSIVKQDSEGNRLDGAQFKVTAVNTTDDTPAVVNVIDDNETLNPDSDKATFGYTGLVAGKVYKLREVKNPAGYTAIDDVYFKINEIKDDSGNVIQYEVAQTNETGEELSINNKNAVFTLGSKKVDDKDVLIANIDLAVFNESNIGGLPITGEAGIMLGLGTGGVIIAISAVSMLRRKKEVEE